jgi:hypothetical protein
MRHSREQQVSFELFLRTPTALYRYSLNKRGNAPAAALPPAKTSWNSATMSTTTEVGGDLSHGFKLMIIVINGRL